MPQVSKSTLLAKLVPGNPKLWDPKWMTRFHLHHRIASSYRKGRIFLAGDAAHIHSPARGQGMNTGMEDAVNLAWKLAAVFRGERSDTFLDTYNTKRRKVGVALLSSTNKAFEFIATMNPVFLFLRNLIVSWVLLLAMKNPATRAGRFRFISQLNIRYRHSPIVRQASGWMGKIKGGDRAPNGNAGEKMLLDLVSKPTHHLVLFSGVSEAAVDEVALGKSAEEFLKNGGDGCNLVMVLSEKGTEKGYEDVDGQLHELYGFKEPGIVFVRPDRYIAYIGPLGTMAELKTFREAQKEM